MHLRRIKSARPGLLNSRGDTIIEVMIVLAVLGLAIGIAYATANRSLLGARQAQENTQATEIIQAQAEYLRSMAANPSSSADYIYRAGTFCIGSNGHVTTSSCNLGEASRYTISVTWSSNPTDKFTIKATWADITGHGNDTDTLVYRVHQPPDSGAGAGAGGGGCPANSTGYSDQTVTGSTSGFVWGTDIYTDDSSLGKAAVHAGLISAGQTATIRVCDLPGQSSYTGSTRNGVTTSNWGSWPGSISLILPGS